MIFKVGDTVVYPHHGAALIEAIETRTIKGEPKEYLVLKVAQGDLTVRVPADNAEYVELKSGLVEVMGLTKDLEPCGFFDKHVWWRGIADLLIVNREKGLAYSLDYKTGKSARYADVQQLDLVAEGVMAHFPEITRIKSGLLFVVSNEFVKAYQTADSRGRYMEKVKPDLHRLQSAFENGVWNASPNNLCGWCPVKTCEHNRG